VTVIIVQELIQLPSVLSVMLCLVVHHIKLALKIQFYHVLMLLFLQINVLLHIVSLAITKKSQVAVTMNQGAEGTTSSKYLFYLKFVL
jgi:hypothetical protein